MELSRDEKTILNRIKHAFELLGKHPKCMALSAELSSREILREVYKQLKEEWRKRE